ncbi:hypothetical protein BO94DRAFT_557708 [Aspergillus sclerotioniger CBS 115572]|uniref:Aminoglycoside phosphotransferase domain-containing protein n=1 Tax=Aspergillus sclerotioniger CBS 115572 TaxID=1450535 RepID=A0A317WF72_9EURO|nr:hypothetical protein BO94DRAFT_557708 [Aspergillus sclerotioniger CBS 115572]PWY83887.1 hypothetical protein BO94DRAFT_557708 [Aspergillus sclerotioniger CBS 115572]
MATRVHYWYGCHRLNVTSDLFVILPANHRGCANCHVTSESSDLFEYTSGRWIYNDALRHRERKRVFNVPELKRLAARSVHQKEEDVVGFEKLAEGGFNRSFLITMRDSFRFIARVPYQITQPKPLVIASEVATMNFLRSHNIPAPRVYGFSATPDNPAETEYIFMEFVQGRNVGDIWFDLSEAERTKIITNLVQLESRLFALRFPASGRLYYCTDCPESSRVIIPTQLSTEKPRFCIGPDTSLGLWYGRRLNLPVERGPYKDCLAVLTAGATKEIAYLSKFGQPLQPIQRLRRETYDYQPQSHLDYIATLQLYLKVAPSLIPHGSPALHRPVLRHPDLQPNIFVSDELEINGLIDWQHSTVLPLFLQCAIPNSLQNYGDDVSESLRKPTLPINLDQLELEEQHQQTELFRRRHLHYLYVKTTAEMNTEHYDALAYDYSTLRRWLYQYASDPWEGDNMTLKSKLITLAKRWTDAQTEADEQLKHCQQLIGVGNEGWVPVDYYEAAKARERTLKGDALAAAETTGERRLIEQNWIFDDFSEDDYM